MVGYIENSLTALYDVISVYTSNIYRESKDSNLCRDI